MVSTDVIGGLTNQFAAPDVHRARAADVARPDLEQRATPIRVAALRSMTILGFAAAMLLSWN